LARLRAVLVVGGAGAGVPVQRPPAGRGGRRDGLARVRDHLAEPFAGAAERGGALQVLGRLVEVAGGEVEPAGQRAAAPAEGGLSRVDPGIPGGGTAEILGEGAAAGPGDAAVEGPDREGLRPLVRQPLAGLGVRRRGGTPPPGPGGGAG